MRVSVLIRTIGRSTLERSVDSVLAQTHRPIEIVIVDTGLMFPTAEMLGIDLVLPDFSYLRERLGEIEAIVLTHGHEDHVGALPYVLREIGVPPAIYGGPLTIGLVRSKLGETIAVLDRSAAAQLG